MSRNAAWALLGNAAYAGCQWIVFVLLVKSLDVAEVGLFAYWIAVTGPVFVVTNVRLRNLLVTGAEPGSVFADYFAARLFTTSAAIAVSVVIGAVASPLSGALVILGPIVGARACDAVSDICHGMFQRDRDMRSAAIGLAANGVFSVALVGASLAIRPSLTFAATAYAAGSCAALLAWDLPRTRAKARPRLARYLRHSRRTNAGHLIVKALPLGLSSAVGSLQMNLPSYVVASSLGPAALGLFAALSYVPAIGNFVVNAVAQATLPLLAEDVRTAPARYRKRLLGLVAAGIAFGAVSLLAVSLVGRPALALVYGPEYADHVGILTWLMAGAAVSYAFLFLGTGTTARLRFRPQLLISLAGLFVVAATAGPLVARHGLTGAAWSLLAGALVQGCGYVTLTLRDVPVAAPRRIAPVGLVEGVRS
jgi:O-antigen/teichoic acid export membrane protein